MDATHGAVDIDCSVVMGESDNQCSSACGLCLVSLKFPVRQMPTRVCVRCLKNLLVERREHGNMKD